MGGLIVAASHLAVVRRQQDETDLDSWYEEHKTGLRHQPRRLWNRGAILDRARPAM